MPDLRPLFTTSLCAYAREGEAEGDFRFGRDTLFPGFSPGFFALTVDSGTGLGGLFGPWAIMGMGAMSHFKEGRGSAPSPGE